MQQDSCEDVKVGTNQISSSRIRFRISHPPRDN